ncbi:hypothetical protein CCHR01_00152 [Colletotrichum chrysophilum]|uniref:Uncharacterized protein n=1 Tax=Colletotrichum chrysophilum TaxID=1836956 RepID=A0AAD9B1M4_9PEZI|nr:hypothetical protein CCHR01_00152 [Colletotrichum chrysophilum]
MCQQIGTSLSRITDNSLEPELSQLFPYGSCVGHFVYAPQICDEAGNMRRGHRCTRNRRRRSRCLPQRQDVETRCEYVNIRAEIAPVSPCPIPRDCTDGNRLRS